MNQLKDLFNLESMFSKENAFFKTAEKTHRFIFESFDRTARLQLGFAEDLLDMNRKRFNSLYTGDSLSDKLSHQQELATEFGTRTAALMGDLQEVASELGTHVGESANDLMSTSAPTKPARRTAKAKAA